ENGIALKDDLDQILADQAIDGVVFATPHSQHGPQIERTAAAGKHVFMEKPFTLDLKSAEAAIEAVARAGVVLAVAYPRRFHPAMIELKARIDDGRLGTVSHCESAQASPAGITMSSDYWRSDPQEGLGRACDAGTRIPVYAGYRAAGNRSASRACTRDHRSQGLQRPRSRARRVRCGDQSRTPLPDHRGGSAARRCRVRGDRPFGGGPPVGEGLPMTVIVLYPEE